MSCSRCKQAKKEQEVIVKDGMNEDLIKILTLKSAADFNDLQDI